MTDKEKALDTINGRIESEKKAFSSCEEFMKKDYTQFFVQQADKALGDTLLYEKPETE